MNVYQRPLFRQMGGPVAPGMAAQEAMMPQAAGMPPAAAAQDPMAMAQQVQDMAAQQTQGIGEQYAQATLMNIDQAETPEQIINALRGNEVPLEQRYAELAQFVGEADAQRTPESVLALVQPTIMMTEQGAMDSGIGELMQGLTGEIEMETADGAPTAMGQGVGSLMMAGANAAPEMGVGQQPVANFRQGGVVQRFQAGGEASRLQQLYSEMLPTYQSILGDGGEQRRLTQAQILFDIADRAGAFAAGVDPRTGQSIARLSPAAQLAAATSGLGGQIGERLGSQEEQDRALRLAALQAAQGEFSAERAAARAAAAAGGSRGIGDAYEAVDRETGQVIATEFLATQAQMDAFRLANEGAIVRKAVAPSTDFDTTTLWGEDGQPVSFVTSTAGGRDEAAAALASGEFTAVPPPAPGDQVVLLNPGNPEDSLVVEAGTEEHNQALRMGFRTAADIEAQRKLTTPAEMVTYVDPNNPANVVRAVPGSPEAIDAERNGLLPVSDASTVAGMRPEPVEPVTYVDPNNPANVVRAVPGSPEAIDAERNGLLPVSDASTVAGMRPEPSEPVTYVSPTDPTNVVRAVPGSPEAIDAERNGLLPVSDASTVAGMMPQPTEPATLIERQQATITNQNTLDNLESLSPQELGLFAANAAAYIQETVSVAGVSSRLPLPPNTQEAMRRARAAGIVFPGIDPMSYGATPTAEDIEVMGLNILDPSIDLSAATGLLAPVQRTINFIGEQLADVAGGGTGTAFVDTAEGTQALNTLAQATNRFYLAGRTLALEFSQLQQELVRPEGLRTDQSAIRALTAQRGLLEGDLNRLEQVLANPRRYTTADVSQATAMRDYALQLLLTYDTYINAYGGTTRKDLPTLDQILSNPANRVQQ
jgi:hypothetical protein